MTISLRPMGLLRSFFNFLSRRSLRGRYAVLYILILLGYAYVYFLLPGNEFYHANINREPMLQTDKGRISKEMQAQIADTFRQYYGGDKKTVSGWTVDANTFQVLFLEATDKGNDVEIQFKLDVKLTNQSLQEMSLYIDPIVTFSATERSADSSGGDMQRKVVAVSIPEVPHWEKKDNPSFAEAFFPSGAPPAAQKGESAGTDKDFGPVLRVMPITKRLSDDIIKLARGIQGNPSNLSGYFQRMLYLSAVTITTLGYGDIAPLTTRARLLVLSEAVVGIIVIGLFINAGSQKKSRDRSADSP
ncbi:MAG TPA: potassium channel family protein [Blastocatellia bacterium]|nr:potassium channel family protein [Blastocatellia bacterium]